jgi:hypothetical protein
MEIQSFTYTPTDMAEQLTGATHDTLAWLAKNKYITNEQRAELEARIVVTAIPNKKGFGKKLLDKMFGTNTEENAWVFPIVEIADHYAPIGSNNPDNKVKPIAKKRPSLKVVD